MDNVIELYPTHRVSCWECIHSAWSSAGPHCLLFNEDVSWLPEKIAPDCEDYELDPTKP